MDNNKLDSIVFQNREGFVADENGHAFLQRFGNIDTFMYDNVYYFEPDLRHMAAFLLIRGNTYRYITLGSGRPIISDVSGNL
jgi:hypothetical protein